MEEWKSVLNYEGAYEVSSNGRVKSISRHVKNSIHGRILIKERIIKQCNSTDGYKQVNLCKNGKNSTRKVHILMAESFLKHKHCKKHIYVVDHIDNNRSNNNLWNLQIITNRDNIAKGKNELKTSCYPGVCWASNEKKWKSSITINKVRIHLGYYKNENTAAKIYQLAKENIVFFNGERLEFRNKISSILNSCIE